MHESRNRYPFLPNIDIQATRKHKSLVAANHGGILIW